MQKINDLLDLEKTIAKPLFEGKTFAWEVLPQIHDFILKLGESLSPDEFNHPSCDVWIAKDAVVFPSAFIGHCVIIDHGAKVTQCSYIRENVIVGKRCTVGNSCELKNAVLFDEAEVPHFNYVGDSVLGYKAHMGAGAVTSNLKSDKKNIVVKEADCKYETGFRKMGAILGHNTEIGCNSVLNPGTVVGSDTNIYPLSSVRGVIPANSIYKAADNIVTKQK